MMQIDMDMPEKCSDCKFEYDPYGEYGIHWCFLQGVGGGETDAGREAGRLPSCPLIDVPDMNVGNIVNEQPEIILCKDCRYSEYDSIFHSRYCHNKGKAELVGDNFFCAAGRYQTNGSD